MHKKNLPLVFGILVVILVAVGGVLFAFTRMSGTSTDTDQEQQKKKRAEPVNVIPVSERPYMKIVPLADGRNLDLIVETVKKPATDAEYELEYQAGSQLQGAFGLLELAQLPASFRVLLGSCSAGGACTFHENVQGGTLVTRFQGPENYALKSDWRYFDNGRDATEVASRDAKFQMTSDAFSAIRYVIVFNTAGYPGELPNGTPASDPYSLTASSELDGEATLTIRSNEEGALVILGWDGQEWVAFETAVDGKTATATVDLMELYIVVAK